MDDLGAFDGLGAVLKPYLEPGETPIWVGRPLSKRFSGTIHGWIFAGMLLIVIGLGGLVMAWAALNQGPSLRHPANDTSAAVIPLLAGLGFGAGGVGAIHSASRMRHVLPGTLYAVTTRRALVVDGFRNLSSGGWRFDQSDWSFGPTAIQRRSVLRRRRDGSGDIVFEFEHRMGRKGRHYQVESGFFGVPDVDRVNSMLEGVAAGPKKMDISSVFE
jgi:hypothetical protein